LQPQRTARNNTPSEHAQSSYTVICIPIYDMFDMQIKDRCLRYVVQYSISVLSAPARLIMNAFKKRKRQCPYRARYMQLICTAVIYGCQEKHWTQYREIRKYQGSTIRMFYCHQIALQTHMTHSKHTFSNIFVQQIFATINNSLTKSNTTNCHPIL